VTKLNKKEAPSLYKKGTKSIKGKSAEKQKDSDMEAISSDDKGAKLDEEK